MATPETEAQIVRLQQTVATLTKQLDDAPKDEASPNYMSTKDKALIRERIKDAQQALDFSIATKDKEDKPPANNPVRVAPGGSVATKDAAGNITYTQGPVDPSKTLTGGQSLVDSTTGQPLATAAPDVVQQATAYAAVLNAKVAAGLLNKDVAKNMFDQKIELLKAAQEEDRQRQVEAQNKADQEIKRNTLAEAASATAQQSEKDLLPYMAGPDLGAHMSDAINTLSKGGGAVNFQPGDFSFKMPDMAAIGQRAAAQVLSKIDPYAAQQHQVLNGGQPIDISKLFAPDANPAPPGVTVPPFDASTLGNPSAITNPVKPPTVMPNAAPSTIPPAYKPVAGPGL